MSDIEDQVERMRTVIRTAWHQARRWEQPLEVPAFVMDARRALGESAECDCDQCRDSDRREAYYKVNRW